MEDHRGNLILILAGYQDEMDWFIATNPGIRSRFPIHITFSDYRVDELLDIADLMLKQRQYKLSDEARNYLRILIDKEHRRHKHSGNARLVRNLIERAIRRQAVRLIKQNHDLTRNELMMITGEDLEKDVL
jgi:stage V sporulation protein K